MARYPNQSLIHLAVVHPFPSDLIPLPICSQNVRALASMYLSISLMAPSPKACAMTLRFRACNSLSRQLCVLGAGCTKAS